jgi:hypothetical protein
LEGRDDKHVEHGRRSASQIESLQLMPSDDLAA